MRVPKQPKSYDVLVSISKCLESRSPCTQASMCGNMTNENRLFTFCLHILQYWLKPSKLVTWVAKNFPEIPILLVTSLSSDSKYSSVIEDFLLTLKFKILEVVASFFKGLDGLGLKPIIPNTRKILDHVVWLREALNVNGPDVMITLKWINHKVVSEYVLHFFSYTLFTSATSSLEFSHTECGDISPVQKRTSGLISSLINSNIFVTTPCVVSHW